MTTGATNTEIRKVGVGLGLGILFIPFIFAWFTLRKGHSTLSRVFALGWIFVSILILGANSDPAPTQQTANAQPAQTQAQTQPAPLDEFKKALEEVRDCGVESANVSMLNGKIKLDIVFNETIVVSGSNLVLVTAGKIKRCLKEVKNLDKLKDVGTVVTTIKAPFKDNYGNKSSSPILRYVFKGEELNKINWDEIDQQSLLEFATPEWLHLEGAAVAKEYALDENHAAMAPTFCRIAIYGR